MSNPSEMLSSTNHGPGATRVAANPALSKLADYPFDRLRALLGSIDPPPAIEPLAMSLGEPQGPIPDLAVAALARHADKWNRYPPIQGTARFRKAARDWLMRRYGPVAGAVDEQTGILPLSGTREGLYLIAQAVCGRADDGTRPVIALPNPYYAAYEGGAAMAGADLAFPTGDAANGFLPDLDRLSADQKARLALVYYCHPTNPQGAVTDRAGLARLRAQTREAGAVLVVDECYAEIYRQTPPAGILEAAEGDLTGLAIFHSLSKRSNAAGLRAGFVAGDPALIGLFARLRSYAAASMPVPVQAAAAALYDDDAHVAAIRQGYAERFAAAQAALEPHLPVTVPEGGFFLWLDVGDGEAAAAALWRAAAIRVVPGGYLARPDGDGDNPGARYIRLAVVHEPARIAEALTRAGPILARVKAQADAKGAESAPGHRAAPTLSGAA